MPDLRRQDAALAAATTLWRLPVPIVLPLTIALPAIHGARLCSPFDRHPRLDVLDRPA